MDGDSCSYNKHVQINQGGLFVKQTLIDSTKASLPTFSSEYPGGGYGKHRDILQDRIEDFSKNKKKLE